MERFTVLGRCATGRRPQSYPVGAEGRRPTEHTPLWVDDEDRADPSQHAEAIPARRARRRNLPQLCELWCSTRWRSVSPIAVASRPEPHAGHIRPPSDPAAPASSGHTSRGLHRMPTQVCPRKISLTKLRYPLTTASDAIPSRSEWCALMPSMSIITSSPTSSSFVGRVKRHTFSKSGFRNRSSRACSRCDKGTTRQACMHQ